MRRVLTLALSALLAASLAGPAAAGPKDHIPSDECELQATIGVVNVRDCEPIL